DRAGDARGRAPVRRTRAPARAHRRRLLLRGAVPLRVVAFPDPHAVRAEEPLVPDDLAQPPAAPLQERGLLDGRQLERRRSCPAHEPRPAHGAPLTDGADAARRLSVPSQTLDGVAGACSTLPHLGGTSRTTGRSAALSVPGCPAADV